MIAPQRPRTRAATPAASPVLYYLLSGVFLALTLCLCAYLSLLFFDPQSFLNPIPPYTRTPIPTPTLPPTATPMAPPTLPPQWTPTPEGGVPPSATAITIATLEVGPSPEAATPTPAAPTPTTAGGGYPGQPTQAVPTSGYP